MSSTSNFKRNASQGTFLLIGQLRRMQDRSEDFELDAVVELYDRIVSWAFTIGSLICIIAGETLTLLMTTSVQLVAANSKQLLRTCVRLHKMKIYMSDDKEKIIKSADKLIQATNRLFPQLERSHIAMCLWPTEDDDIYIFEMQIARSLFYRDFTHECHILAVDFWTKWLERNEHLISTMSIKVS